MANEHTDDDCEIMSKNYTKLKGTTTKVIIIMISLKSCKRTPTRT